jgi:hypothetical protein
MFSLRFVALRSISSQKSFIPKMIYLMRRYHTNTNKRIDNLIVKKENQVTNQHIISHEPCLFKKFMYALQYGLCAAIIIPLGVIIIVGGVGSLFYFFLEGNPFPLMIMSFFGGFFAYLADSLI